MMKSKSLKFLECKFGHYATLAEIRKKLLPKRGLEVKSRMNLLGAKVNQS